MSEDPSLVLLHQLKKRVRYQKEKIERLNRLIEINAVIVGSLEKGELMKKILLETKELMNCQHSSVLLIDPELNQLVFAAVSDEEEKEMLSKVRLNMGEGIAGNVWGKGQPMIINNAPKDTRFSKDADEMTNNVTDSLIAVPLVINGKIIGVLEAINKEDKKPFTALDLEIFQHLAVQVAIAIDNSNLYQMVITDSKTQLYANRYFAVKMNEEMQRAIRYNHPLAMVMFDIDHFKHFNDTYGHQMGDLVLIRVAQVIKQNCRNLDIPSRFGGEEFNVLLPMTQTSGALEFAERIRKSVENMEIIYNGERVHLTISAGVVSYPEITADSGEEMMKMADIALYYSKENGRNRVSSYTPDMEISKKEK